VGKSAARVIVCFSTHQPQSGKYRADKNTGIGEYRADRYTGIGDYRADRYTGIGNIGQTNTLESSEFTNKNIFIDKFRLLEHVAIHSKKCELP